MFRRLLLSSKSREQKKQRHVERVEREIDLRERIVRWQQMRIGQAALDVPEDDKANPQAARTVKEGVTHVDVLLGSIS